MYVLLRPTFDVILVILTPWQPVNKTVTFTGEYMEFLTYPTRDVN